MISNVFINEARARDFAWPRPGQLSDMVHIHRGQHAAPGGTFDADQAVVCALMPLDVAPRETEGVKGVHPRNVRGDGGIHAAVDILNLPVEGSEVPLGDLRGSREIFGIKEFLDERGMVLGERDKIGERAATMGGANGGQREGFPGWCW